MNASALARPFVLSGTGGRRALFAWTVVYHLAALGVLAWGPLDMLGPWSRLVCYGAFGLASAAWICAIVRRLHDMGRSGLFAPLFAIPVVGLAPLAWALTASARPLDPERFRPRRRYRYASVLILICVALFASRAFWAPHRMVSLAMAPTLERGTPFVSYRFGPGLYAPGDIVLVGAPAPDGRVRRLVARVVATGGQRVALEGGIPVLDGVPADHAPCQGEACTVETLPGGASYRIWTEPRPTAMPSITVPDGALFLLSDNRTVPRDSRHAPEDGGAGLVPVSAVEGYVLTLAKVRP